MQEDELISTARQETARFRRTIVAVCTFVVLLWVILAADAMLGLGLYRWGVYPRTQEGLLGILTAPLIHGSWSHLFANTLPLVILGTALIYGFPRSARVVLPVIYLGSGLGVWLMARGSFHIGASGLTHGMLFFVFLMGILRRDRRSIALALLVFFLYGGMVWTIFPYDPDISFESHFFGALTGALLAFALRRRDPAPPRRRYDWEDEDETADARSHADTRDPPGPTDRA